MFKMTYNDLVAGLKIFFSPAFSNKVYPFCGTANKDNFIYRTRIQKGLYFFSCVFISIRGPCCQYVRSPMYIRILMLVEITDTVDDLFWFLCSRCVIKPDQWTAVNTLLKDGKIAFKKVDVKRRCCQGACFLTCFTFSYR